MAWQRFCTIDGMNKKHVVRLTQSARDELTALIAHGVGPARQLTHARILLKADQGPLGPGWTDAAIAGALEVSVPTIERVRQRYVTAGRAAALLHARPVRSRSRRLDGAGEAHLIALTCGTPPAGRTRWTMRLLAERLVELAEVPAISHPTVWRTLKKTISSPGCGSSG